MIFQQKIHSARFQLVKDKSYLPIKWRFIDIVDLRENSSGSIAGLHNSENNHQVAGMRQLSQKIWPSESVEHLASITNLPQVVTSIHIPKYHLISLTHRIHRVTEHKGPGQSGGLLFR
jgi:hypothetical protein